MKDITLLAVKHAALLLIESNQLTTTLEVKELLRHLDYEADQQDVSELLAIAGDELPLSSTTIYQPVAHRIYTLPPVSGVVSVVTDDVLYGNDAVIPTIVQPTPKSGIPLTPEAVMFSQSSDVYTSRFNGDIFLFDDADVITSNGGTVYRSSYGASGITYYYAQDITREQARSAHAGVSGLSYNSIGSSDLKAKQIA